MKRIFAVIVLPCFVFTPVLAADTGFYVGGGVGQSNTSQDNVTLTKKSDTAFNLLGGYKIATNFAVETLYADLELQLVEIHQ